MKQVRLFCAAAVMVAVSACTQPADPEVPVFEVQSTLIDGDCMTHDCGLNSAVIDGVYFSELYKPNAPFPPMAEANSQGFRLIHYYLSENNWGLHINADAQLDVAGSQLAHAVVNSILEVGLGDKRYIVKLVGIDRAQQYWTTPLTHSAQLETYWFQYTKPEFCTTHAIPGGRPETVCTEYKPVCKDKPLNGREMAMPAVVFEGDRYVQATLAVENSPMNQSDTWFNIACAGSLPSKMHFIRRTRAGALDADDPMPIPSLGARQAFANAWSANYCGDAYSFTAPGKPLRIRDRNNTMRVDFQVGFTDDQVASFEAIWGPQGAICLNIPRHEDVTYDGVRNHCLQLGPEHDLPPCSSDVLQTWTDDPDAVLISVNPTLVP